MTTAVTSEVTSFPALQSESVAEKEMFSFLRLFLKQQKASAEQKNVYPWFLSERSQFPFFIAPDSAPIFDKGCKSTKIADVSNNEFSPPKQSHSIKLNPPFLFPERLITQ